MKYTCQVLSAEASTPSTGMAVAVTVLGAQEGSQASLGSLSRVLVLLCSRLSLSILSFSVFLGAWGREKAGGGDGSIRPLAQPLACRLSTPVVLST